mmetsp:Transcript_12753/g.44672  ORF Transcript_12753/g.44672 Transcript_12753/m.44672 type:complete len:481 (-) Transcript_12753:1879-3321(-)
MMRGCFKHWFLCLLLLAPFGCRGPRHASYHGQTDTSGDEGLGDNGLSDPLAFNMCLFCTLCSDHARDQHSWKLRFSELMEWKQMHGTCEVPVIVNSGIERRLSRWIRIQRNLNTKGTLHPARRRMLDSIGFKWRLRRHGAGRRPRNETDPGATLRRFKSESAFLERLQPAMMHGGSFSKSFNETIESVRSPFSIRSSLGQSSSNSEMKPDSAQSERATWLQRYAELKEWRDTFGHCNVPYKSRVVGELGRWVTTQRTFHRLGILSDTRRRLLDALGFTWDLHTTSWEEYFNLFLLFRIVHGHSNVPYRFRNGSDFSLPKEIHRVPRVSKGILIPNLGAWVNNQRALYRNGKLSAERIKRLENMGFVFEIGFGSWNVWFNRLLLYKMQHGTVEMTFADKSSPEDRSLMSWVTVQRSNFHSSSLSQKRRQFLESIGLRARPRRQFAGEHRNFQDSQYEHFNMMGDKESVWILHSCNNTIRLG